MHATRFAVDEAGSTTSSKPHDIGSRETTRFVQRERERERERSQRWGRGRGRTEKVEKRGECTHHHSHTRDSSRSIAAALTSQWRPSLFVIIPSPSMDTIKPSAARSSSSKASSASPVMDSSSAKFGSSSLPKSYNN
jgi:hypothetical protein